MRRKIFGVLIVIALLAVGGTIIYGAMPAKSPPVGEGVNTPSTQPSVIPSAVPVPSPQTDIPASKEVVKVAQAAKTNIELLSSAMFMQKEEQQKYVNEFVAPQSRAMVQNALQTMGGSLATSDYMKFSDVSDAATNADYYEQPLLYRVETVSGSKATVSLFVQTHWVSADGVEHVMVTITVMQLQRVLNAWRYVSSSTAPKNLQPVLPEGLNYDQTVERFRPFLKGFKDVANIVPPSS